MKKKTENGRKQQKCGKMNQKNIIESEKKTPIYLSVSGYLHIEWNATGGRERMREMLKVQYREEKGREETWEKGREMGKGKKKDWKIKSMTIVALCLCILRERTRYWKELQGSIYKRETERRKRIGNR